MSVEDINITCDQFLIMTLEESNLLKRKNRTNQTKHNERVWKEVKYLKVLILKKKKIVNFLFPEVTAIK